MPERASLNQAVQIAVETVPGTEITLGTSFRKLQAIGIEPSISVDIDSFRPVGQKYNTVTNLGKEWTEASLSGRGSYTELVYLCSSVISRGVITTPGGATNTRKWVFTSSSSADDDPVTFTVQHGSGVRAGKFTYGIVTELSLSFDRDTVEVGGSLMGRAITDGVAITTGATTPVQQNIQPTQVTVYLDTASGSLGTTKLLRVISAEFNIGGRYGPVWVVDAANPGFVGHVETEPDLTLDLVVQADAQGMALLNQMRDGTTRFVRIRCVGSLIEGAFFNELWVDMAVKVADTGGFSDEDGVYAIEFNFVGVHDGTWGKAYELTIFNTLTAL